MKKKIGDHSSTYVTARPKVIGSRYLWHQQSVYPPSVGKHREQEKKNVVGYKIPNTPISDVSGTTKTPSEPESQRAERDITPTLEEWIEASSSAGDTGGNTTKLSERFHAKKPVAIKSVREIMNWKQGIWAKE